MGSRNARTEKFLVHVEPFISTAFRLFVDNNPEFTYSGYIRRLIIDDLRKRELITDQMIVDNS